MSKSNPKILFIGPTPPPYSGPELSMKQFLDSEVLNQTFNILFLKTNFRSDNKKKGKFGLGMVVNFFKFFFKLFGILVSKRPQAVYYPITPTQIGWLGRDCWTILMAKLFKAKVIIHLRGSHFKLNFTQFHGLTKKLIGFSLRRVDKAIVQAKYLSDQFTPYISETNVAVLYQAMDIEEFTKANQDEVKEGKILIMGHMTKAKGYTDVLKVIPEVCTDFPNAKFYFAGDMRKGERGVFFNQFTGEKINYEDPFVAEHKILQSSFRDNYVNLGIIRDDNKMMHLKSTQIFLTASYSEGFSRSLLEAMAVGKPLIYTPVGAHREVLKDGVNGYCIEPGNAAQLKEIIVRGLSNIAKLEEMGKNNRQYVVEQFSIQKISNDFKEIILNTVNS